MQNLTKQMSSSCQASNKLSNQMRE
jgi:hypothetical protein